MENHFSLNLQSELTLDRTFQNADIFSFPMMNKKSITPSGRITPKIMAICASHNCHCAQVNVTDYGKTKINFTTNW